ncbi:hypothetical protein HYR54_15830 [Candidatus Acetothermia bacterium]|nr:hypothetical protein [Candidatus Acetothermia bacterium]
MATQVQTKVRAIVKTLGMSVTHTVTETIHAWLRITGGLDLDTNMLINGRDSIEKVLKTWITSRHLKAVFLEVYHPGSNQCVARFDLVYSYDPTCSNEAGGYTIKMDSIDEVVKQLKSKVQGAIYRIIVDLAENAPQVPGWTPTQPLSTDGLTKESIGNVFGSPYIEVGMDVLK